MTRDRLRVAVVGAGIAGLTLAAALRRSGVDCDVYDQAPELAEVGAGIQVSPNATRLLDRLGAGDALRAAAVRPLAVEMRRWDDDSPLLRTPLAAECEDLFGAPYLCLHRAHLHAALRALVDPARVHLGRRLIDVEEGPQGVTLRFADGSSAAADIVAAADGIRSIVRQRLVDDAPVFSGQYAYRGLVPADRLPVAASLPRVGIWMGPGRHAVCYPVAGGRAVSFAATVPSATGEAESWQAVAGTDDLLAAYDGWTPALRSVMAAAESVTRWALHDRTPPPRWHSGRIVLLGDAAHPVLPFGAQGAAQAIEDAVALAACLAPSLASGDQPEAALERYERSRRPRVERVFAMVRENARNHHVADGAEQRTRDASMGDRWSLHAQAWLYGHDAERQLAA